MWSQRIPFYPKLDNHVEDMHHYLVLNCLHSTALSPAADMCLGISSFIFFNAQDVPVICVLSGVI